MRGCALAETQGRHGQMRCSRGRSIRLVARAEKVAKLWLRDFERCQSTEIVTIQPSGPLRRRSNGSRSPSNVAQLAYCAVDVTIEKRSKDFCAVSVLCGDMYTRLPTGGAFCERCTKVTDKVDDKVVQLLVSLGITKRVRAAAFASEAVQRRALALVRGQVHICTSKEECIKNCDRGLPH